uniref:EamA domain-containing protein n=1 Tax=viral metagenome TaxID=1070528 RepID=A0A6C0JHI0_9ZZZZ
MSFIDIGTLTVCEIVGDFGYQYFANGGGIIPFAVGTSGYIGVVYYLIKSLQGSNILLVNGAWDGISAIIESLAAIIFLGEQFGSIYQYIGLLFIIIGLFFLKIPLQRKKEFKFPRIFGFETI